MDDTKELTLRRPVKIGDDPAIATLTLREPTAKQHRAAARGENVVASDMLLVAAVAGVKPAVIEALGARDFTAASDWLGEFRRVDPAQMAEDRQAEDLFGFALVTPVQVGNVKLDQLTLHEPTAAQLRQSASGENGVASDIILIHLAANVDPALVGELCTRDYLRAARWLGNFLQPATSAASD